MSGDRSLVIQIVEFLQSEILNGGFPNQLIEFLIEARNGLAYAFEIPIDSFTRFAGPRLLHFYLQYFNLQLGDETKCRFVSSVIAFIMTKIECTRFGSDEHQFLNGAQNHMRNIYGFDFDRNEPPLKTIYMEMTFPENINFIEADNNLWKLIMQFFNLEIDRRICVNMTDVEEAQEYILRAFHEGFDWNDYKPEFNLGTVYNAYMMASYDTEKYPRIAASINEFILDHLNYNGFETVRDNLLKEAVSCLESAYDTTCFVKCPYEPPLLEIYISYINPIMIPVRQVQEIHVETARLCCELANDDMQANHYYAAIKWYTSAIDLDPVNYSHYCSRAELYKKLKLFLPAIENLKAALKLRPSSSIYHQLGGIFETIESYFVAGHYYGIAHNMDPENDDFASSVTRILEHIDEFIPI